ncbi:MAG: hypothetical protein HC936_19480 [Leptolyngbyaceae cyanobacterium SU_3_3]|nr:hypothetical protein [Leptolyngbyaceae cyanobacterium SU_3_3]
MSSRGYLRRVNGVVGQPLVVSAKCLASLVLFVSSIVPRLVGCDVRWLVDRAIASLLRGVAQSISRSVRRCSPTQRCSGLIQFSQLRFESIDSR